MSRNWKPGDVGADPSLGYRGIFVNSCRISEHGRMGASCWHNANGLSDPGSAPRRPLVVIDPEDEQAVGRLVDEWATSRGMTNVEHMQAALREFANPQPPKPEEPTGLGAVVEDADGARWVRFASVSGWWWRDGAGCNCRYAGIDAVKVLSEGVQ